MSSAEPTEEASASGSQVNRNGKHKPKPRKGQAQLPEWWLQETPHLTLDIEDEMAQQQVEERMALFYAQKAEEDAARGMVFDIDGNPIEDGESNNNSGGGGWKSNWSGRATTEGDGGSPSDNQQRERKMFGGRNFKPGSDGWDPKQWGIDANDPDYDKYQSGARLPPQYVEAMNNYARATGHYKSAEAYDRAKLKATSQNKKKYGEETPSHQPEWAKARLRSTQQGESIRHGVYDDSPNKHLKMKKYERRVSIGQSTQPIQDEHQSPQTMMRRMSATAAAASMGSQWKQNREETQTMRRRMSASAAAASMDPQWHQNHEDDQTQDPVSSSTTSLPTDPAVEYEPVAPPSPHRTTDRDDSESSPFPNQPTMNSTASLPSDPQVDVHGEADDADGYEEETIIEEETVASGYTEELVGNSAHAHANSNVLPDPDSVEASENVDEEEEFEEQTVTEEQQSAVEVEAQSTQPQDSMDRAIPAPSDGHEPRNSAQDDEALEQQKQEERLALYYASLAEKDEKEGRMACDVGGNPIRLENNNANSAKEDIVDTSGRRSPSIASLACVLPGAQREGRGSLRSRSRSRSKSAGKDRGNKKRGWFGRGRRKNRESEGMDPRLMMFGGLNYKPSSERWDPSQWGIDESNPDYRAYKSGRKLPPQYVAAMNNYAEQTGQSVAREEVVDEDHSEELLSSDDNPRPNLFSDSASTLEWGNPSLSNRKLNSSSPPVPLELVPEQQEVQQQDELHRQNGMNQGRMQRSANTGPPTAQHHELPDYGEGQMQHMEGLPEEEGKWGDPLRLSSQDIISEPALDFEYNNEEQDSPEPPLVVPERHPMTLNSLVSDDTQEELTAASASLEGTEHEIYQRHVELPEPEGPMRIIMGGAPASGRATQCRLLKDKYDLVHLSTFELLWEAIAEGNETGKQAKAFMDGGQTVPDQLIVDMVRNRLSDSDCVERGWVLEGFPRTPTQAKAFSDSGISADIYILLSVPDDVLFERAIGRRMDPDTGKVYHVDFFPPESKKIEKRLVHLPDDTEERYSLILNQFHANLPNVTCYFSDIEVHVDGSKTSSEVSEGVLAAIKSKLQSRNEQSLESASESAPELETEDMIVEEGVGENETERVEEDVSVNEAEESGEVGGDTQENTTPDEPSSSPDEEVDGDAAAADSENPDEQPKAEFQTQGEPSGEDSNPRPHRAEATDSSLQQPSQPGHQAQGELSKEDTQNQERSEPSESSPPNATEPNPNKSPIPTKAAVKPPQKRPLGRVWPPPKEEPTKPPSSPEPTKMKLRSATAVPQQNNEDSTPQESKPEPPKTNTTPVRGRMWPPPKQSSKRGEFPFKVREFSPKNDKPSVMSSKEKNISQQPSWAKPKPEENKEKNVSQQPSWVKPKPEENKEKNFSQQPSWAKPKLQPVANDDAPKNAPESNEDADGSETEYVEEVEEEVVEEVEETEIFEEEETEVVVEEEETEIIEEYEEEVEEIYEEVVEEEVVEEVEEEDSAVVEKVDPHSARNYWQQKQSTNKKAVQTWRQRQAGYQ